MARVVTKLKVGTTIFCLSNANTVYIKTILEVKPNHPYHLLSYCSDLCLQSKGLLTMFDEIVTNPAEWDSSELLKIRRRIDPEGPQHSCKVGCSPNMCKGADIWPICVHFFSVDHYKLNLGEELETFLSQHPPFDRVIYVGDGANDFCPVLRLRRLLLFIFPQ
jgi:pyridoxal phosphate phosphatase PHOSPHO2